MLSVGSLCTGYGGLEMGLQAVYGDVNLRFVSDIDEDASTLLAHHHPNVPNLGDLTVVDWADIEPVDVLCAGYPCQPFSTAGKRKGLEDERAIFEYIADAISVLRPRNVLLENVSGHLTLGGTTVIATLTRLGYNAKWGIVQASDTGAPHQRKRLFIWAYVSDTKKRHAGNTQPQLMATPIRSTAEFRKPVSTFARWSKIVKRQAPEYATNDNTVNPVFVEWLMGLPEGYVTDIGLSRQAQLKILGNGVVPQQAALALHLLAERGYYAKTA
jgi:DNA (cytosine-5)-methyltransferase 1